MAYAPRLFIAFYLDADVDRDLAAAIRQHGFDAISAREIGNDELDDTEQLEFAISEQRTIVTHNHQHFRPLYDEYWEKKRTHYGIIVSEQVNLGAMLHRVLVLLDTFSADELVNMYYDLGEFR